MSEPTRTVERCLRIAAPRPEVFRALLDPAALSRWMYATVRWKPVKGAGYRIEWQETSLPAHAQGEILEIVDDRRLTISWFQEKIGCETTASFELDDDEAGCTLLKFRHRGFPIGPEWQARFDMVALEWDKSLENLRFHVEESPRGGTPYYARHQISLPASRERAHLYWVGPAALRSWLAEQAFVDPAAGGEIDLILKEGGRAHGLIRTFAPGKHMRVLWEEEGRRSLLGLSFWPEGNECVMTLTQRSYQIGADESARQRAAWDSRLAQLGASLARGIDDWTSAGTGKFEVSRVIDAPCAELFRSFTDPVRLVEWFCDRAEFTPRVDHPYAFLWTSYGDQRGRVLAVEPDAGIRLSWAIPSLEGRTEVELKFAPASAGGEGTRVEIIHTGWGKGDAWDAERRGTECGWRSMLAMLEFYSSARSAGGARAFILRRMLPVPTSELWRRFSAPQGLATWLGEDPEIDAREGGAIKTRLRDGSALEGVIEMLSPEEGIAIRLKSPEISYVEFGWSPTANGSNVLVTGRAYGMRETWPLQQRILWAERLARIAGA